ncbi:tenascin-X [Myxococcaceae bacterium GXIMD 01537]
MGRTTRAGWALLLLALGAVVGACRDDGPLTSSSVRLRLSEDRLDFEDTFLSKSREATVRVLNAGRAPLDVTWTQVDPPFTVEGLPSRVDTAGAEVRVRFAPTALGVHEATLTGTESGGGQVTLRLKGQGIDTRECPPASGCRTYRFDLAQERCVEEVLPDGTACTADNQCLTATTCKAGVCQGRERVCDDGDACTTDTCNPLDGCQSVPAPPCPGDGACRMGTCDPKMGCALAPAPDGTLCGEGATNGCDSAQVCVEGACVERNLPDGFVCAPASPCQGEGRCAGPVCVRPEASAIQPDWTFDAAAEGVALHDFVVGPTGDITLAGFFENIVIDSAGPAPVRGTVAGRRCMLWNERLLCMDLPESGQVSLMERATGKARWTFDFASERPAEAQRTSTLFLARLAVMAPDRLAALFEAYPVGASPDTLCRMYFLVVLDAAGKRVSSQELKDPLLSKCDHPHPFGLASDTAGDLYLTFSRTPTDDAPLVPHAPTLLMAFTSEGVERWRRTESFGGGELAVVRGLLIPERGPFALRTADGMPTGSLPSAGAGRAVATTGVLVASPDNATSNPVPSPPVSTRLEAYGLPGLGPVWRYVLAPGLTFSTKEIRLGAWTPSPSSPRETVVLGLISTGLAQSLVGVRARDGREAFRCELGSPPNGVPGLMELGPGGLVVMDGLSTCGECDPPFAHSQARFQRFPIPGLAPADGVPWSGTFGGPGHGHHETR